MAGAVEQSMKDPKFIETANILNCILKFMGPDEYKSYLEPTARASRSFTRKSL
jgi:tripartite-type tricarboxylate transporter receptor subunit TctC